MYFEDSVFIGIRIPSIPYTHSQASGNYPSIAWINLCEVCIFAFFCPLYSLLCSGRIPETGKNERHLDYWGHLHAVIHCTVQSGPGRVSRVCKALPSGLLNSLKHIKNVTCYWTRFYFILILSCYSIKSFSYRTGMSETHLYIGIHTQNNLLFPMPWDVTYWFSSVTFVFSCFVQLLVFRSLFCTNIYV